MTTKRITTGWRAFSAAKESAYGTPQTVDTSFNFEGPPSDIEPNEAQTDANEITGYHEATKHEILNWRLDGSHKQRAMPHNIAFFLGAVLGSVTTDQPDVINDPDVYRHWFERDIAGVAVPSFTLVEYDGVAKKRFAGAFIKSFKLSGDQNDFIKMEADFGAMGKEESSAISKPAVVAESYLRYGDVELTRGGALSGTVGAGTLAVGSSPTSFKTALKKFEYGVSSDPRPIYEMGDNSGYVSRVERGERWNHSLSAVLEMADDTHKTALINGTEYVLNIPIVGGVIAGGSGNLNYTAELIFPRVVYREARKDLDGDVVVVKADFEVMEDTTYGSVIVKVQNKQSAYLA